MRVTMWSEHLLPSSDVRSVASLDLYQYTRLHVIGQDKDANYEVLIRAIGIRSSARHVPSGGV